MLRYLLRHWLQKKAAETVAQSVSQATREHTERARAAEAADENPQRACHVALIAARPSELAGLAGKLERLGSIQAAGFTVEEGRLAGRRLLLVVSGEGAEAAERATEAVLSAHRPQWVVAAGFATGLDPAVQHGDIMVADRVIDTHDRRLSIDLGMRSQPRGENKPAIHVGRLLTVDRPVHDADAKAALAKQYVALAADTETMAVAQASRRAKARFVAVRVIADAVDQPRPGDVDAMLGQKTKAGRFGAALRTIAKRPGSVMDMFAVHESALAASGRLGDFLVGVIEQLVPQEERNQP